MKRITRALALGCAVAALAACSHKDANAPLAHVPADTPYLIANLKPFDDDSRKALLQSAEMQKSMQASRLHDLAEKLADENKHDLANLVRYSANYFDQHSYAEIETDSGIDPDGLFAIYGLGLSPVLRGELKDADKFHRWVAGFEKAYGHNFAVSQLDKVKYQHLTLGKSKLQLVIASHDKQYVVAVLPAENGESQLRMALGLDKPEASAQDKHTLKKLADANGYGPYLLSYVNFTKLPKLIAGGNDPMLKPLFAIPMHDSKNQSYNLAEKLPASCEPDLARIAARMPMLSSGYTKLDSKDSVQQMDVRLAPDIVNAFKDVGTSVPGLGDDPSKAMLDMTLALPVPKIRDFWLAQAEAVHAKPFTCPALTSINDLAAKTQQYLPKLGIPPLGDLRGLRVVVDQYDTNAQGKPSLDSLRARVLIASHNPSGLFSMAQAMLPPLAKMAVKPDGKPVAFPAQARQQFKVDDPAWAAMNKQAVAIGIGADEKDPLSSMLDAGTGKKGTIVRSHLDGSFYAKWLTLMQKRASHQATGENADTAKAQDELEAVKKIMGRIEGITTRVQLTDQGLRTTAETRLK